MSERSEQEITSEIARHAAAISACAEELARVRGHQKPRKRRKLTPPAQPPSEEALRAVSAGLRRIR
jgi:hypothetical protein